MATGVAVLIGTIEGLYVFGNPVWSLLMIIELGNRCYSIDTKYNEDVIEASGPLANENVWNHDRQSGFESKANVSVSEPCIFFEIRYVSL